MITVRRARDRGHTQLSWLDSRHTFSFGDYYDPEHLGFSSLRVINDDRIAPAAGFGTHGHRDMEIVSYVVEGELEHRDSLGTGSVIRPGEIQMMRAGTGITHSEFNPSKTVPTHLLQIWIIPDARNLEPTYAQQRIDLDAARKSFALLVSGDGRDRSIRIHQDVELWLASFSDADERIFRPRAGCSAWIHVVRGEVNINGTELGDGDAVAIRDEQSLTLAGNAGAELLVFDLR